MCGSHHVIIMVNSKTSGNPASVLTQGTTHQSKLTVVLWLAQVPVQTTPPARVAALLLATATVRVYSSPDTNTVLAWHATISMINTACSRSLQHDLTLGLRSVNGKMQAENLGPLPDIAVSVTRATQNLIEAQLAWHAGTVVRHTVPSKMVAAGVELSCTKVMMPPASSSHCAQVWSTFSQGCSADRKWPGPISRSRVMYPP